MDSAVQLLQSVKELGFSLPKHLTKSRSWPYSGQEHANPRATKNGLKAAGKIPGVVIQTPINLGVALTQGLHNSPRLWGGKVRRKQPCVTGVTGGLKAGVYVSKSVLYVLSLIANFAFVRRGRGLVLASTMEYQKYSKSHTDILYMVVWLEQFLASV